MASSLTPQQAEAVFRREFGERINVSIKELLETRHLYQSVTLAYEDLITSVGRKTTAFGIKPQQITLQLSRIPILPWQPDGVVATVSVLERSAVVPKEVVPFKPPDVKLFCKTCNRIEPYNLLSVADWLRDVEGKRDIVKDGQRLQVWIVLYLCQGCKEAPEVFLIRRHGPKIMQCGRSPIEHVPVPKDIPKDIADHYSGAVVAHQSGQTLAGLFLLRTVIEQWVRLLGANHQNADQAFEWYMTTLPNDFKERFPSMRALYSDLSVALHTANADQELFERAITEIQEHFEARRINKVQIPRATSDTTK